MQEILPPEVCPACDTLLVWENDQLFCTNTRCSGKTSKKIKHFAKTLKIKGLGPRTIEKLEITSICLPIFQSDTNEGAIKRTNDRKLV